MAVIIQNVSAKLGLPYEVGDQVYDLRINTTLKATFVHKYEDGLAACLRKAADALEREEANTPE